MQCEGKVAVVTGAAGKGMGRSIALTLAREGAKTIVNYRTSEESAGEVVSHIREHGGEAVAIQADVFTADGCRKLVDAARAEFDQIDICVIGPGAGWHPEPVEKIDAPGALEDADHELAPVYHLLPLVLPGMYDRRWGRIVGICLDARNPSPSYAYNVAKAARTQALLLTQGSAWKHGVTVNVMAPGPVAAIGSLEAAVEQCAGGAAWQGREDVSPQDVAETVAFLCSDAGSYITGCVVPFASA